LKYKSITGTKDILPAESFRWQHVEETFRELAGRYNFREIRTPLFEQTQLFARGIGELTDIVGKEMYTFEDRSGNSLTLKPEMTAAVVRAYLQHTLAQQQPVTKVFYLSPMFRQERPQKGRLRQFHQFGLEILGSEHPEADGEIILMTAEYYGLLGLHNVAVKINSVGCENCRPPYKALLKEFLSSRRQDLSADSQRRFEQNPLRILDSKDERDLEITANAPLQLDHLCGICAEHFRHLQEFLRTTGTPFTVDGRIVRGLDYYTKTAFECTSPDLGSQDALSGGGRYDLLAGELGGPRVPAVGVAGGIERLLLALDSQSLPAGSERRPTVYLAAADDATRTWLYDICRSLRGRGIDCDTDLMRRSLKAQMREASRQQARFAVIAGSDERNRNEVMVKDLNDGGQQTVRVDALPDLLLQQQTNSEYAAKKDRT
jgi:histidyl-tRNA synthetase